MAVKMTPTHIPFNIDVAGADNRFVAYQAGCRFQIEAFERGADLHQLTADAASRVLGRPITRKQAKGMNHGLNYLLSVQGAARNWNCSLKDAEELHRAYFRINPEIRDVFQAGALAGLSERGSTLTNVFGRSRRFFPYKSYNKQGKLVADDKTWRDACNWLGQSPVAHVINNWALIPIYYTMPEVILTNQVHDSVEFQIPLSVGWIHMAELVMKIRDGLHRKVEIRGRVCQVLSDAKMGTLAEPNWGPGMRKIEEYGCDSVGKLAADIKRIWRG